MLALRLGNVLLLGFASTQLKRDVTVTFGSADRNHLAIFKRKDGDRHVPTIFLEQAGHTHLLRDHAGAHDLILLTEAFEGPSPKGVFSPYKKHAPSGLSAPA